MFFLKIIEEYSTKFICNTKGFLIDDKTWQAFALPNNISLLESESQSVLDNFKNNKSANCTIHETQKNIVFDTLSPNLKINLNILTNLLEKSLHTQKDEILLLELSYDFINDKSENTVKFENYTKIKLPLSKFIEYLIKDSVNFIKSTENNLDREEKK
jgi:hypothetical protein